MTDLDRNSKLILEYTQSMDESCQKSLDVISGKLEKLFIANIFIVLTMAIMENVQGQTLIAPLISTSLCIAGLWPRAIGMRVNPRALLEKYCDEAEDAMNIMLAEVYVESIEGISRVRTLRAKLMCYALVAFFCSMIVFLSSLID